MNIESLQVVGLALFAMGTLLLAYVCLASVVSQIEAMRARYAIGMESEVEHAKYFLRLQRQVHGLNLLGALFGGLGGLQFHIGVFGMVFGAIGGWFLPSILAGYFRKRSLARLNIQFVQALTLMANAMRAGESLPQAIESTRQIVGAPMAQELAIVAGQIRVGASVPAALNDLVERVPLGDVKLAVTAMLISIRTGANLPEAFQQIAETIRNRMTVQGKINTLTVQGRTQGLVAGLAPFALGGLFYLVDPDYIGVFFNTFVGNCVVSIIIVMQVVAFFMIRKIVSINI